MRRQQGQALVETILCLPLFMIFLVVIVETTQLYLAKMELASITRETALMLSRLDKIDGTDPRLLKNQGLSAAQTVARQTGRLDWRRLTFNRKPASGDFHNLAGTLELPKKAQKATDRFLSTATGEVIILRYRIPFRGLKRIMFSDSLTLEERLVVKTNFMKHPIQQITQSFLRDQ